MSNYFLKLSRTKTAVLVALFGVVPPIIFYLTDDHGVGVVFRRSRFRVSLWPPAGFVLGFPEFKFSADLRPRVICKKPTCFTNSHYLEWIISGMMTPTGLQFIITIQNCFSPTELKYWRTCGIVALVLLFICFLVIIALIIRPVSCR